MNSNLVEQLYDLIDLFAHRAEDTRLDGMEWVRLEKIERLAGAIASSREDGLAIRSADHENQTPLQYLFSQADCNGLFLREIMCALLKHGAPLLGDDGAYDVMLARTGKVFKPSDHDTVLGSVAEKKLKTGAVEEGCDKENLLHRIVRKHPQLLADCQALDGVPNHHETLRPLMTAGNKDGNTPLHLLLDEAGPFAKASGIHYPGEQLCEAMVTIAWPGNIWTQANTSGRRPLDLLADRLEEFDVPGQDLKRSLSFEQAIAPYLGPVLDMAKTEIERRIFERDTQPTTEPGRNGLRL